MESVIACHNIINIVCSNWGLHIACVSLPQNKQVVIPFITYLQYLYFRTEPEKISQGVGNVQVQRELFLS
ncbi:unnamed protein product [Allacma fusca]|uniref:Uncharacterized protein n=1 Tax=Allacma fusca TaxID=39272 RepID=A0A8J2K6V1_9HEXA|nr:unnamed protein product [Allacma fusca]